LRQRVPPTQAAIGASSREFPKPSEHPGTVNAVLLKKKANADKNLKASFAGHRG
jgi:hypothetical protein